MIRKLFCVYVSPQPTYQKVSKRRKVHFFALGNLNLVNINVHQLEEHKHTHTHTSLMKMISVKSSLINWLRVDLVLYLFTIFCIANN